MIRYGGVSAEGAVFRPDCAAFVRWTRTAVAGFIDIDADMNAATGGNAPWGYDMPGGNSWINFGVDQLSVPGPPVALGDEYYIDLGSEAYSPGSVSIYQTSDNTPTGPAPITFAATSFEIVFSQSLIGGATDFNFGALVGTCRAHGSRPQRSGPAARSRSRVRCWSAWACWASPGRSLA